MSDKETKEEKEVVEEKKPKRKKPKILRSKKEKDKEKIQELELGLDEAKDKYLRLFAEFENFKKRSTKERLDLMKTAGLESIKDLLPVLDDFDRAKQSADSEESTEKFSEGVTLVYQKLHTVLNNKGLSPMVTNGEIFDPELHEAITEIPAPSEDMKGKIIDTIEKGYMLNEKIIRFPKVVVGK